jgi:hypothetical protein
VGKVVKGDLLRMEIGTARFEVELYDAAAARDLLGSLPQRISMSRWGDEFYGTLARKVNYAGDPLRDVFAVGEIAYWPPGNALCIFFGPTPASREGEPRMASPGVALGKIKGDPSVFRSYGSSLPDVNLLSR